MQGYLSSYITHHNITDPTSWVKAGAVSEIERALANDHSGKLKPVFEALDGRFTYNEIRIVTQCRRNRGTTKDTKSTKEEGER